TLQVYAQPFVSKGNYSNARELAAPRAAAYDDRCKPYTGTLQSGFNFKQFNSNVVLRWEYRPGSTLFVVWTDGRRAFLGASGPRSRGMRPSAPALAPPLGEGPRRPAPDPAPDLPRAG